MNWILLAAVLVPCLILVVLERRGLKTTLSLSMRGDIKRESRFLAQYGQSVCGPLAALLVWQLDPVDPNRRGLAVIGATAGASLSAGILKRLFGRVRPNRENEGKFLGPSLKHANWRESFPSSHSACAVAMTFMLAALYPAAAITFWSLAAVCAALRYVLDAHWPSDVLAGVALGYACGFTALKIMTMA
jgi:membrane-associated phospholipid phosphatase